MHCNTGEFSEQTSLRREKIDRGQEREQVHTPMIRACYLWPRPRGVGPPQILQLR